jgi:hypothetical protein
MEQMKIPEEMMIDYDYKHADKIVRVLHPAVWKEGDSYCCLLGPDPTTGIFGCGDTPEDATDNWQENLKQAMIDQDSEMAKYVQSKLLEHKKKVDADVSDFLAQLRPVIRKKH